MKKWIEKDGKHVLVIDFYGNEIEILELREDEDDKGYDEPYFLYKSFTGYSKFANNDFFGDLDEAKKSAEEILIEETKDSIAELQNILDALEVNYEK